MGVSYPKEEITHKVPTHNLDDNVFNRFTLRIMSIMSTPQTLPPAAARMGVKKLTTADALEAFREKIREDVRQEELGKILTTLGALGDTINLGAQLLSEVASQQRNIPIEVVSLIETRMQQETAEGGIATTSVTLPPLPPVEEEEEQGIEVSDSFLDFIESHTLLSKYWIDRRPLLNGVRADYSNKGEAQLKVLRAGTFDTDHHMRNTILTLVIGDDNPYVSGEFMDDGQLVPMSEEQVDRVCMNIVDSVRKAKRD
jgi:hypothetical protein